MISYLAYQKPKAYNPKKVNIIKAKDIAFTIIVLPFLLFPSSKDLVNNFSSNYSPTKLLIVLIPPKAYF